MGVFFRMKSVRIERLKKDRLEECKSVCVRERECVCVCVRERGRPIAIEEHSFFQV